MATSRYKPLGIRTDVSAVLRSPRTHPGELTARTRSNSGVHPAAVASIDCGGVGPTAFKAGTVEKFILESVGKILRTVVCPVGAQGRKFLRETAWCALG